MYFHNIAASAGAEEITNPQSDSMIHFESCAFENNTASGESDGVGAIQVLYADLKFLEG